MGQAANQLLLGCGGNDSGTLQNGVIASYKLSDLVDASGNGRDLTNNGVATFGTPAKIGNAGQFDGALTQSLSSTDAGFILTTFTLAAWFRYTALSAAIIGKKGTGGNSLGYEMFISGAADLTLSIEDSIGFTLVGYGTSLVANQWYLGIAWCDVAANEVGISLDNGTPVTDLAGRTPGTSGGPFCLGASNLDFSLHSGQIDIATVWNRVLTAAERTSYYNGGTGVEWPF